MEQKLTKTFQVTFFQDRKFCQNHVLNKKKQQEGKTKQNRKKLFYLLITYF